MNVYFYNNPFDKLRVTSLILILIFERCQAEPVEAIFSNLGIYQ